MSATDPFNLNFLQKFGKVLPTVEQQQAALSTIQSVNAAFPGKEQEIEDGYFDYLAVGGRELSINELRNIIQTLVDLPQPISDLRNLAKMV